MEAARLMYFEDVGQYLDAKRTAAKRVLGRDARGSAFRAWELPSNGEIREALLQVAGLAEGAHRDDRLAAMRLITLQVLQDLRAYHPRLIGSVWSGHVRRGSDIDVHVFVDHVADLQGHVKELGWRATREQVTIRMGSEFKEYTHLHVHERRFPVELSVYPVAERRRTTRSSTDGRPIDRVKAERLAARIAKEHPEAWRRYGLDGSIPIVVEQPADEFGGLLWSGD